MVAPRLIDSRFDDLSPQERRHLHRCIPAHRRQRVRIEVQRDFDLLVSEAFRDDVRQRSRLER